MNRRGAAGRPLISTLFLIALAAAPAEAKVTRYLTGDAADVRPKLHGPAFDFGGGGGDVFAAFQWMIDQVRGCTDCATKLDVVVLRSSGADGYNKDVYALKGVDSVETLVVTDPADAPAVAETVRNAEVIFFAGGDQCNYVRNFKGNEIQAAVESVYARGGGVGGTSAGLAIQGEFSYDGCTGSARSKEALADPYDKELTFTYGFFRWRYMRDTITDTHFVVRDRLGRSLVFIARQIADGRARRVLDIAVNEKTSVVVDRRGVARVMGAGPAYFILGDHPPEVCRRGAPLTFSDYKIWRVPTGGTFDLRHRPTQGYYLVSVERGQITSFPY